jgi:signal transduction histidine kinase
MDDGLEERIRRLEQELDGMPEPRTTWFLEPERATTPRLAAQIALASSSPVVEALLKTGAGAIAILNDRRQVIALNAGYLALLGVDEPGAALGLRPGETVRCVHASDEAPGGCGTGPACRTCGAAISILAALEKGTASERDCALTVEREGSLIDAEFRVRSQILELEAERFVLLSLVDVSAERRRASLERAVFHDLSDLLVAMVGACDEMDGSDYGEITVAAADAREVAARVTHELKLQQALMAAIPSAYAPSFIPIPLGGIIDGLRTVFQRHPVATGKRLRVSGEVYETVVETDPQLLGRVLGNMLMNAFEASPPRTEVSLRADVGAREVTFRVWNPGAIPSSVIPRIFQRYFTTKPEPGRGQGTFVMKFFGERILRGRVAFTTTKEAGTTFELRIPRSIRA